MTAGIGLALTVVVELPAPVLRLVRERIAGRYPDRKVAMDAAIARAV